MLENCRVNKGEKKDSDALAQKMAKLCDIYVNDAFGTAHRAEATTHGIAKYAPIACAGPLLAQELDALGRALGAPKRPLVAIRRGLQGLDQADHPQVARRESRPVDRRRRHRQYFPARRGPSDRQVACRDGPRRRGEGDHRAHAAARCLGARADRRRDGQGILAEREGRNQGRRRRRARRPDPRSRSADLRGARQGRSAQPARSSGTARSACSSSMRSNRARRRSRTAIADSAAFSIAGGGDTLAAIAKYGIADKIGYISTGGGAFLEFLEGKTLPAVAVLESRAQ